MSDVRTAKKLISVVEVVGVRLTEVRASTRISPSEELPQARMAYKHKASVSKGSTPGAFKVVAKLDVRVTPVEEEPEPLVRVSARFELAYKVPADFVLVTKELNAFARVNAIYNAWPYFRELVQSTSTRMGLPALVLPVFRIPRPKESQGKKQAAVPEQEAGALEDGASQVTN